MSTTVTTAIVNLFIGTHVSISPMFIPMIFSAQIPLQMKGVMLGTGYTYGTIFIVGIVSATLMDQVPFKIKLSVWGMEIISCGFWFLFLVFLVQISMCFALVMLTKRYKGRKREDMLPNEYYYVEKYYSKDSSPALYILS